MARDLATLNPMEVMLKYIDDVNKYIENQRNTNIKAILAIQEAKNRLAEQEVKIARLSAVSDELYRLGLVIESAVRNGDAPNHAAIVKLVEANIAVRNDHAPAI